MPRLSRLFLAALLVAVCTPAAPASAASELGDRALHRGQHGHDVKRLQQVLRRLHVARLSVDGAFGGATERAVRRYERRERLHVDGRVSKGQGRGLARDRRPRRHHGRQRPRRRPDASPSRAP
jgi:peptidoglycan hydrolase-like protein with peptidoglycan-binding domain